MKTNSILIAYPSGEEPSALALLENLNSLGTVVLRPYSRLKLHREKVEYDVALCIVVDETSIAEAHDLQQRLENIPTIVVDNASGQSIPVNGFSGLVSPAPEEIAEAVSEILQTRCGDEATIQKQERKFSPLASRFDSILSRLGGISQGGDAVLAAAARHLAWELHAERAEAYVVDSGSKARRVFATSTAPAIPDPMSEKALQVLQKRGRLTYIGDLTCRQHAPLLGFLKEHDLNVVAPLLLADRIVGWLVMSLEESLLTYDFLDDLHIATHLLSMSLSSSSAGAAETESPWCKILSSFETGLLIVSSAGTIIDSTGQTLLIGGAPKAGQSFKSIRRGRIREVIAEALRGNLMTETWYDPHFDASVECSSSQVDSGEIALKLCLLKTGLENPLPQIELSPFFETLPVPVIAENVSGASSPLPVGTINVRDSESIRHCATTAKSKNVKALRIRYTAEGKKGRAVMFFESSASESESHLAHDISEAVEFNVTLS